MNALHTWHCVKRFAYLALCQQLTLPIIAAGYGAD